MSPLSAWMIGVAALLTSPALWSALVAGEMAVDVALTRFLLAIAGCWVVTSLASDLVWPASAVPVRQEDDEHAGD